MSMPRADKDKTMFNLQGLVNMFAGPFLCKL